MLTTVTLLSETGPNRPLETQTCLKNVHFFFFLFFFYTGSPNGPTHNTHHPTADGQKHDPRNLFSQLQKAATRDFETFSLGYLVDCHRLSNCNAIGRDTELVPVQQRAFTRKLRCSFSAAAAWHEPRLQCTLGSNKVQMALPTLPARKPPASRTASA